MYKNINIIIKWYSVNLYKYILNVIKRIKVDFNIMAKT